jgi:hypothetical protein
VSNILDERGGQAEAIRFSFRRGSLGERNQRRATACRARGKSQSPQVQAPPPAKIIMREEPRASPWGLRPARTCGRRIWSGALIGFVNWLGHIESGFRKSCALELHGGMFDVELVRETFLYAREYFFAVFQVHVRDADVA